MDIKNFLNHFKEEGSKHSEVSSTLSSLIKNGTLKPGERLPTEEKMAKDLNVSKAITRKAYHDLMVKGLIQRLPKKGIVVSHAPSSRTFSSKLQSIGEDMVAMGLKPSIQLVSASPLNNQSRKLNVFDTSEHLFCVIRVILADGQPLMVMESYYSLDRFPNLALLDLKTKSIFEFLKTEYHEDIRAIQRTLEPIFMPKDIAKRLNVTTQTPCNKAISIAVNAEGRCVEYGIIYGIGDRYSISL